MRYKRIRWLLALFFIAVFEGQADTTNPPITLVPDTEGKWTSGEDDNIGGKWKLVAEYADVSYIAPTAISGLTYTGEFQELISAGSSEDGTMVYSLDGKYFSKEIPTVIAPGTYTVYYKLHHETGYTQAKMLTVDMSKTTSLNFGNNRFTHVAMPEYDVKLVVEYKDIPKIEDCVLSNVGRAWVLPIMPECDMKMVVEYEDIPPLSLDFVYNGDDTWTLDEAPDFNTKMVVEYESVLPEIALLDNADNSPVLTANEGLLVDATLQDRTLYKDGKWNTLTLPFDVPSLTGTPLEGATIMEMNTAKKNGFDAASGTLYLAFETATQIEAGKPYLVKWTNGKDIVEPVFSDVTISSTTPTAIESATSGLETVRMVGNYAPVTVKADDQSIMFMGDDNSLYYSSEDRTLRNFRAHFEIPSQQSAPALAHRFVIDFDGDEVVSGIDGIRIVNSDYTDGWYSLDGRRLNSKPLAKGVYIHNGNKVIVK